MRRVSRDTDVLAAPALRLSALLRHHRAMVRRLALGLTCVTGFSGLVYEVAWQKYLATLLGSHSEATAAVLALFLGGLSVGYSLFGRLTRRLGERAAAHPPARL